MANIYISSARYAAVAAWVASTAYSSTANGGRGDYVRQAATPAVGSERVFRCTTSGTSLASEPAWALTKNATTTETAGPVWTECTGQEADQVSGTWRAPHARSANAFASTWGAAGDVFFVGDDHAETQAAALTWSPPGSLASPSIVQCVDRLGTVPPVAADVKTGATVTTTGANAITMFAASTVCRVGGIEFRSGSGAVTTVLNVGVTNSVAVAATLIDCKLSRLGTSAGFITFGGNSPSGGSRFKLVLINTTMNFGNVGDTLFCNQVDLLWQNTASAILGTVPTLLFASTNLGGTVQLEGIDLSALGSGKTIVGALNGQRNVFLKDVKLGSGVTVAATPDYAGGSVFLLRGDSGATAYRTEKYTAVGAQVMETAIVRTGGASDGATPVAWNLTTNANAKWVFPFEAVPLPVFNTTIGASITATVEGIWNAAALPNSDDIFIDLEYLGSVATPMGSFITSTKANFLSTAAALAASTQAWDSLVTARADSTTYAVGNVRKVASNPGRIFFVTAQTAASAASEPAGFASAVDGGTVTDGGVTWRAAVRFKMAVTASSPQPQMRGHVYAYPKVGKASTTVYLDPKLALS